MSKNKAVRLPDHKKFFEIKILRVQQVADLLTFSKDHVYRLVSQNKIPSYKRGKTLFFIEEEILEWALTKKGAA